MLPAASRAVTVSTLVPDCNAMPLADQLVVPVAGPLPPWLLLQVSWVTPTLSLAVPLRVRGVVFVVKVLAVVGLVMATVGGVASGGGVPPPTNVFMSDWMSAWLSAQL